MVRFLCVRAGYRTKDPYVIKCSMVGDSLLWNSSDVSISHECVGTCSMCSLLKLGIKHYFNALGSNSVFIVFVVNFTFFISRKQIKLHCKFVL